MIPPQGEPQFVAPPDTLPRERDVRPIEVPDTGARLRVLGGAHWTTPTGVTAHVALMLAGPQGRHGEYGGPFLSAEAGQFGAKGGIGIGGWSGFGGALLRASYLRSWGSNGPLEPDQGFLGLDARLTLRIFALGIGWHGRISGDADGDGSIFTFSAGLGF